MISSICLFTFVEYFSYTDNSCLVVNMLLFSLSALLYCLFSPTTTKKNNRRNH